MGYHHQNLLTFNLRISPEQSTFENNDMWQLIVDLTSPVISLDVDIYLILLDPAQKFWFGLQWNNEVSTLISNVNIPVGTALNDIVLIENTIPSSKPPLSQKGTYYFAIVASKPGTFDFLSNPAITPIILE